MLNVDTNHTIMDVDTIPRTMLDMDTNHTIMDVDTIPHTINDINDNALQDKYIYTSRDWLIITAWAWHRF